MRLANLVKYYLKNGTDYTLYKNDFHAIIYIKYTIYIYPTSCVSDIVADQWKDEASKHTMMRIAVQRCDQGLGIFYNG